MNRPHVFVLLRALAPYLALWLVCCALVGGAAVYAVVADRDRDRDIAQKDATNLTRLMQAQAMRTLDAVDRTLTLVRAVQERHITGSPPHTLFQTLRLGDDPQNRVTIFDRDGRFITTTDSDVQLDLAVGDRDYFRAARDGKSDALILSSPLKGRLSGRTIVPAVKRVTAPSGDFDGIVVAALDPTTFIGAYRDIELGDGEFVGVAQRGGHIIAKSTPAGDDSAVGLAELPPGAGAEPPPIGWAAFNGETFLVATRPLPGSEMYIFAARPQSDVFAGNMRFANVVSWLAGLALLALAMPIGYAARRSLRVLRERETLEARARIDPLTQTHNRAALQDRLQLCLASLRRDKESFALAYIDIDDFKMLNDSRGHTEGDRALARIAAILQASVRRTDLVARMGGDEFAVLLPAGTLAATKRAFEQVIEMLRVLARREAWPISFSIGVITFRAAPQSESDAIAIADRVMYKVKQTTKDGVCFAMYDQHGLSLDTPATTPAATGGVVSPDPAA